VINGIGQTLYQTKTEAQNTISITPDNTLPQGLYLVQTKSEQKHYKKNNHQ
jgi:hypothetical protein